MRIESDIIKTVAVITVLVGTYAGVVFWPGQKQNQALADEILNKQTEKFHSVLSDDLLAMDIASSRLVADQVPAIASFLLLACD